MRAPGRNRVLTFRAKNARFPAPPKPRAQASPARGVAGTDGNAAFWHSVIEAAEPIRGRLAARLAALRAGIVFRLRVADAMLRMFAREFHAVLLRLTAYGCALAAIGLVVAEVMTRGQPRRRDRRHRMGRGQQAVSRLCAGDAGIRREPLHDLAPRQWRRTQGPSHLRRSRLVRRHGHDRALSRRRRARCGRRRHHGEHRAIAALDAARAADHDRHQVRRGRDRAVHRQRAVRRTAACNSRVRSTSRASSSRAGSATPARNWSTAA